MLKMRMAMVLLLTVMAIPVAFAAEPIEVAQIGGRISDNAGVLSHSQRHRIYQVLAQYEFASHNHVVVVTADNAGDGTAALLAERIWQGWANKKKPTSVLLLLVAGQKTAAIVAGDDLDKLLDGTTINRIINEKINPSLSHADFDEAAMEGVKAILGAINP